MNDNTKVISIAFIQNHHVKTITYFSTVNTSLYFFNWTSQYIFATFFNNKWPRFGSIEFDQLFIFINYVCYKMMPYNWWWNWLWYFNRFDLLGWSCLRWFMLDNSCSTFMLILELFGILKILCNFLWGFTSLILGPIFQNTIFNEINLVRII